MGDTLDFSGDVRSVRPMPKLPQRLMLMLDFCTVIIILITAMVASTDTLDFSGDVRSARLMLMLDFCTDIIILITMVTTTDTRDFSGDVRSVRPMLKLPQRLILVPAAEKFAGTLCPQHLFMDTWDDFFKMYARFFK